MSERLPSPEPDRPSMNTAQDEALRDICRRYNVDYNPADYFVYSSDSSMMPLWAEGWVGGNEQAGKTIYVGVSPEGEINS